MRKRILTFALFVLIAVATISFTTDKALAYYETEIQNAIVLLDEHGPADWRKRVDIRRLDMRSFKWCLVGQVFQGRYYSNAARNYRRAIRALHITTKAQEREYGFLAAHRSGRRGGRMLTADWKKALSDQW